MWIRGKRIRCGGKELKKLGNHESGFTIRQRRRPELLIPTHKRGKIFLRVLCGCRCCFSSWPLWYLVSLRDKLQNLLQSPPDKRRNIFLQFTQRFIAYIHHVSGAVVSKADALVLLGVQSHMVERVLGGKVRRCQVEIARPYEQLHKRILVEGITQCLGSIRKSLAC